MKAVPETLILLFANTVNDWLVPDAEKLAEVRVIFNDEMIRKTVALALPVTRPYGVTVTVTEFELIVLAPLM